MDRYATIIKRWKAVAIRPTPTFATGLATIVSDQAAGPRFCLETKPSENNFWQSSNASLVIVFSSRHDSVADQMPTLPLLIGIPGISVYPKLP